MTPRTLVCSIAAIFATTVVVCIAANIVNEMQRMASMSYSHLITRGVTALVLMGLAVRLGLGLVKGCKVDRWATVLAAAALAFGIYRNAGESPSRGLIMLGAAFCGCALGLFTPFAGRHFKRKATDIEDSAE